MEKKLNIIKRLVLFFVGVSIIQMGVALFLKTNIGSDPFTVFTQGLAFLMKVTPGRANMVILITLFAAILLAGRSHIKIGTLICVVGVGPVIDFGVYTVSHIPVESFNLLGKSVIVALGCAIIAAGFSIVSATKIGVAPNDIVPFIIQEKTGFQYRWIRMVLDAGYLVVGYLFGGVFGIGTIISLLLIGPCIQFCLPYGEKFVNAIVGVEKLEEDTNLQEAI